MNNQQLLKSPHKRCIKEDQIVASSTLWNHFHVSHSPCCLKAIQISDSNGNFPGIWWLGIINSDGGWGFELSERNTKTGTSWNAVSGWDKSLTWIWDLLYACIFLLLNFGPLTCRCSRSKCNKKSQRLQSDRTQQRCEARCQTELRSWFAATN